MPLPHWSHFIDTTCNIFLQDIALSIYAYCMSNTAVPIPVILVDASSATPGRPC